MKPSFLTPITVMFQTVGLALIASKAQPIEGTIVFISALAAQMVIYWKESKEDKELNQFETRIKSLELKVSNQTMLKGFGS